MRTEAQMMARALLAVAALLSVGEAAHLRRQRSVAFSLLATGESVQAGKADDRVRAMTGPRCKAACETLNFAWVGPAFKELLHKAPWAKFDPTECMSLCTKVYPDEGGGSAAILLEGDSEAASASLIPTPKRGEMSRAVEKKLADLQMLAEYDEPEIAKAAKSAGLRAKAPPAHEASSLFQESKATPAAASEGSKSKVTDTAGAIDATEESKKVILLDEGTEAHHTAKKPDANGKAMANHGKEM